MVLKDVKIKKAHEQSAQKACEAAAAIRTVASLTREEDCMKTYREALRAPAKVTHDAAIYSNILYALSQSFAFWVIALGFWYGSRLLINEELDSAHFFTVLTAVVFGSIQGESGDLSATPPAFAKTFAFSPQLGTSSLLLLISPTLPLPPMTVSRSWTLGLRSIRRVKKVWSWTIVKDTSSSRESISDILLVLLFES